jgi:Protein kinase domain
MDRGTRCVDEHLVLAFLNGQLPDDQLSQVECHLDECEDCFELVAAAAPPRTASRAGAHAAASDRSNVRAGQRLAGRYDVVGILGSGASGQVVKAIDGLTQGTVALKLLRPGLARDPEWVGRLTTELKVARQLNHRHVCRVFDLVKAEGLHFLVMELAEHSLREELRGLKPRGPTPMIDALAVVSGLAAIHGGDIVHRDIKPENVLRMSDGRLALSDFGLAVVASTHTAFTLYVGTPLYMAPELAEGASATVASDIWALGIVLHEIFFGERPRWKTSARERTLELSARAAVSPHERELRRICRACLALIPAARPRSVVEVGDWLRALSSRSNTVVGLLVRGCRTRVLPTVVVLAAVVTLLAGSGIYGRNKLHAIPTASRPVPLLMVRSRFTPATPAWAAAAAERAVVAFRYEMEEIIEIQTGTPNPKDSERTFVIELGEPAPTVTPKLGPIGVYASLFLPGGRRGSSMSGWCPSDKFRACLSMNVLDLVLADFREGVVQYLAAERVRVDVTNPIARAAMESYLRASRSERSSGRSIASTRLLELAHATQPDAFPVRLERAWSALDALPGNLPPPQSLVDQMKGLRATRPDDAEARSLECRVVAQLAMRRDSPSDDELRAAEKTCTDAWHVAIKPESALFALASLSAYRCGTDLPYASLFTLIRAQRTLGEDPSWPSVIYTRLTHAGRLSIGMVLDSLTPYQNLSHREVVVSLINGGRHLQTGALSLAESDFRRALAQVRNEQIWAGGTANPGAGSQAAGLRGLIGVARARKSNVPEALNDELAQAEGGTGSIGGGYPPPALLAALWVDPDRARSLLVGSLPPRGCGPSVRRAILLQALGDRAGRDAVLAGCKDDQAWIRKCRAQLSGPVPPATAMSIEPARFPIVPGPLPP